MSIPTTSAGQLLSNLAGVGHRALHDAVANALNLAKPAVATGSTDPTIASATPAALANPTITMTTKASAVVDIDARMTVSCTSNDGVAFYVRVDGGAWVLIGDVWPDAVGRWVVNGHHRFSGLSAASHTFELGWGNTAGTATSYGSTRKLRATEHYPG